MIQKQFLNKLKDFGLNTYEARLWVALLSRGVSTAGELSDIANVPRSRSYDVLESLEKKGFIIMKIGKPIKYIAVPPEEVIERVKKNVRVQAEQQSVLLEGLKSSEIITELNALHTQGVDLVEPSDLTGSFKGKDSIYNHVEMLVKSAEKSVSIIFSSEDLIHSIDGMREPLRKAAVRGVKVRIAVPITDKNRKIVQDISAFADIRSIESFQSRFCIVDEKEIVFMLFDDKKVNSSYDAGVWVNTPYFAKSLQSLFDSEWEKLKAMKMVVMN